MADLIPFVFALAFLFAGIVLTDSALRWIDAKNKLEERMNSFNSKAKDWRNEGRDYYESESND